MEKETEDRFLFCENILVIEDIVLRAESSNL